MIDRYVTEVMRGLERAAKLASFPNLTGRASMWNTSFTEVEVRYYPHCKRYAYFTVAGVGTKSEAMQQLEVYVRMPLERAQRLSREKAENAR
jgi:hypothetical protein